MTQANDSEPPTRQRAFCYITANEHIVLLGHIEHPHLKLQIPGGTIEPGETPAAAAIREAAQSNTNSVGTPSTIYPPHARP